VTVEYADTGAHVAAELVNTFPAAVGRGDGLGALRRVLAVDPPSARQVRRRDVEGFAELAGRLAEVFDDLRARHIDAAAERLNALLARHSAHPHLAREDGQWRLHHHPADAALVPMWTAICAEGLARVLASGESDRLGTCARAGCERVYLDGSKNGSRRFCSLGCQNRVKAAAFRRRQAARVEHAS
jgi:predicted RNA-binding Zn ribbon-like protein